MIAARCVIKKRKIKPSKNKKIESKITKSRLLARTMLDTFHPQQATAERAAR